MNTQQIQDTMNTQPQDTMNIQQNRMNTRQPQDTMNTRQPQDTMNTQPQNTLTRTIETPKTQRKGPGPGPNRSSKHKKEEFVLNQKDFRKNFTKHKGVTSTGYGRLVTKHDYGELGSTGFKNNY